MSSNKTSTTFYCTVLADDYRYGRYGNHCDVLLDVIEGKFKM